MEECKNNFGKPYNYKEKLQKTRFRRPSRNEIQNRILAGILMVENIKISDIAKDLGISRRAFQAWIYEGRRPLDENIEKVTKYLNLPEHILFGNVAYLSKGKARYRLQKARFRTPSKVQNRILLGILYAEDIKVSEIAKEIDVSTVSLQRWIYGGAKPSKKNVKKISKYLNMPSSVLFGEVAYSQREGAKK